VEAQEIYLRAILATVARQTFPTAEVIKIIGKNAGEKQFRAFNLCDGTRTQGEIAKELSLDSGNFSRTLGRWVDEGIAVRIAKGQEIRPVHVYPIPESEIKKALQA
jgi:DNA-binding MarR family transcriptional regulator